MPDSTDIDALVIQARATARELNELLEKLEAGGVEVSVIWPRSGELGTLPVLSRVDLTLRFRPERSTGTPYTGPQNPYSPAVAQEQFGALRHLKNRGIL